MTGPKRTSASRPVVTEREILDAALALLDAGGPAAASIRRIAAAVAMPPNTVYTYFPDQAAVGRALVDRLLGEIDQVTADGDSWRAAVEAFALELRRRLIAHPGAVPLVLGGSMDGRTTIQLSERLLELLSAGGLRPMAAARGAYVVLVYVFGAVALEAAGVLHADGLAPEPDRIAARRAVLAEVPAVAFPYTAAAAGVVAGWIGTDQYVWGLRRVLDGLEQAHLD